MRDDSDGRDPNSAGIPVDREADVPDIAGRRQRSGGVGGDGVVRLTKRELAVLELLTQGKSNKEIARILVITIHTVKAHITRIFYKLGVQSRTEAAVLWMGRVRGEG